MAEGRADDSVLEPGATPYENAVRGIGRYVAGGGGYRTADADGEKRRAERDFRRGLDQLARAHSDDDRELREARRDLVGVTRAVERETVDVEHTDPLPTGGGEHPTHSTPDREHAERRVRELLELNGFEEGTRTMREVVTEIGRFDALGEGVDDVRDELTGAAAIGRVERPDGWRTTPESREGERAGRGV